MPADNRWNGNRLATHVTATFTAKTIIIGKQTPNESQIHSENFIRELLVAEISFRILETVEKPNHGPDTSDKPATACHDID